MGATRSGTQCWMSKSKIETKSKTKDVKRKWSRTWTSITWKRNGNNKRIDTDTCERKQKRDNRCQQLENRNDKRQVAPILATGIVAELTLEYEGVAVALGASRWPLLFKRKWEQFAPTSGNCSSIRRKSCAASCCVFPVSASATSITEIRGGV